mmetsp:Transcript_15269/g.38779  ORF Transcript_15269/g.38779 Transcript_15269/m.38779 type:complete len:230 (+) Transcript_15269:651-1340(+)
MILDALQPILLLHALFQLRLVLFQVPRALAPFFVSCARRDKLLNNDRSGILQGRNLLVQVRLRHFVLRLDIILEPRQHLYHRPDSLIYLWRDRGHGGHHCCNNLGIAGHSREHARDPAGRNVRGLRLRDIGPRWLDLDGISGMEYFTHPQGLGEKSVVARLHWPARNAERHYAILCIRAGELALLVVGTESLPRQYHYREEDDLTGVFHDGCCRKPAGPGSQAAIHVAK